MIHRLVAENLIPNPENKPCVNHKDGDKWNNSIINLEWCTYSENEQHSYQFLGKTPARGAQCRHTKLTREMVLKIREMLIKGIRNNLIAKAFGMSEQSICNIKKGRDWAWL
jgi:hypothetical protein